jgi:1,4-dihydroxy-2-naphthoate octaprenyltransferase
MKNVPRLLLIAAGAACVLLGFGMPRLFPGTIPQGVAGTLAGLGVGLAASLALAALLRRHLPDACDAAPKALRVRHMREMVTAMAIYVVTLVLSMLLLKWVQVLPLRALLALAPLLPIALVLRTMIRYIRDVDEMQQRIELESVCFATAMICLLYMGAGFLQVSRVIDVPAGVAMIWVFPLACLFYGLAKVVVARRYG